MITVRRTCCICWWMTSLALSLPASAQEVAEPVVARLEMKLTLGEKVIDTIQPGDLLTVLAVRDESYVIQTFSGHKGAIAKVNTALLAEATPIYDELVQARPTDGRLHTLRAGARWAAGDIDGALADFNQAIELGYTEAHAFTSRGLFRLATREYDLAIGDFDKAVELDPQDEVPLLNRASALIATGNYERAVEDYTAAIALRPENAVPYTQRAVARKLLGDMEAAIEDYDQAIRLSGEDVAAIMGRGFIKFQLGRHAAAIEDFTHVIELSPESAVAFNNRGYNYQQLKQYPAALADYRRAVELAPRYLLAHQNLAWLLTLCEQADLRDPVAAIASAKTACEISDYKDLSDLTLLAAAHAAAGEFETAIGWQEKALAIANEEQRAVFNKILEGYQQQRPLDPGLLETEAASAESSAKPAESSPPSAESTSESDAAAADK